MTTRFCPDYAFPPGRIIAKWMEVRDMSLDEFSGLCSLPVSAVEKIIAGTGPLDANTAVRMEKVTGMTVHLLLSIETSYRLKIARDAELVGSRAYSSWAKTFCEEI